MQHNKKLPAVWMIAGVLIMLYLVNRWISSEISQPTPQQTVEAPVVDAPKNQTQALTIPGVPIDEHIVEPEIKIPVKKKEM